MGLCIDNIEFNSTAKKDTLLQIQCLVFHRTLTMMQQPTRTLLNYPNLAFVLLDTYSTLVGVLDILTVLILWPGARILRAAGSWRLARCCVPRTACGRMDERLAVPE